VPAYTRLDVDERRRRLLALGADVFTRHAYDELSMAAIAREAGISKALLYHYFPSKQAFFQATLEQAAAELAERVRPSDDLAPAEQLMQGLDGFLAWIEENETAYRKLMQSVASVPEARELVERVRHETADLILAGLTEGKEPPPELRTAVRAGCGSRTAPAWSGSSAATWSAPRCSACCWARSWAPSRRPGTRTRWPGWLQPPERPLLSAGECSGAD
jgi:AcrR family transcriptional regulator